MFLLEVPIGSNIYVKIAEVPGISGNISKSDVDSNFYFILKVMCAKLRQAKLCSGGFSKSHVNDITHVLKVKFTDTFHYISRR